jgi:hypothetical protein
MLANSGYHAETQNTDNSIGSAKESLVNNQQLE